LRSAAHYFKLSADQGDPDGQCFYGLCLRDGKGISPDLRAAAHYLKLSADQQNHFGQYYWAMCLLTGSGLQCDLSSAIEYFKLSAANDSADGRAVVGWMAENGIGTSADFVSAARYYEQSADHSSAGAFRFGLCCQSGRGVPVDFTIAAEFFRRAADSGDADGANSFGCCLERGDGVDANIELAVHYYHTAASQSHPSGLYNFGRCLEYGLGIECDLVRAAKYYRKSADFGDPSGQNSFGIFLERGIGVRSNQALAAQYFERSAVGGDPDGANNFGFCLEHGRSVRQNIAAAAEWYRFAADHGHPEGEMNYQRCHRLLGQWTVPDRSTRIVDRPRSDDLTRKFIAAIEDPNAADRAGAELVTSIERLKCTIAECAAPRAEWTGGELSLGNSAVALVKGRELPLVAVKTVRTFRQNGSIQHEIENLKKMDHPLVVRLCCSETDKQNSAVVTEFVANGTLADHVPDAENHDLCRLTGPTRIARIVAGIALALRYVHGQGIVHRNLTPDNILLDWDWNVRICDFWESISANQCTIPSIGDDDINDVWFSVGSRYLAPECFNNIIEPESDVFSFGMILYELIVGRPGFPKRMTPYGVGKALIEDDWKPDIPENVIDGAAELIRDCLAVDHRDRPSFIDILHRLKEIQFQLMPGVNSTKVAAFVESIEEKES
jgi:TPR repeat protein